MLMMQPGTALPLMSWSMSSGPQGSGPPAGAVMIRDPPEYSESADGHS